MSGEARIPLRMLNLIYPVRFWAYNGSDNESSGPICWVLQSVFVGGGGVWGQKMCFLEVTMPDAP